MNFYTDEQPIIACSTGTQSNTAIAVIRLSGFKNLLDLQHFFSLSLDRVKKRQAHLTNIKFKDSIYDNGLLIYFPAGQSYTGENVLELNVHGNLLNVQRITDLFIQHAQFRPAHPGEFTYRALRNKKLSLSQVEGLDMLLNANSSLMLSQGLEILQGDLHAQYLALYDEFLRLKAAVEISIDFSEDVGVEETQKLFHESFDRFLSLITSLKRRTEGNVSSLLSPEIALVGQTNAGKSSLFNLLLRHDRSIVSNIAGTTRDYVSEVIFLDGTNYKLVDTAGIRESSDTIENIGIERALVILKRAFFKVLVVNPFETNPAYLHKLDGLIFDVLLFSHSDVEGFDVKVGELELEKISANKIFIASFTSGSIEPLAVKVGPIEPLAAKIGPIEPLAAKIGPIEPLAAKVGPIEPLAAKVGPIEPLAAKVGPIEPLAAKVGPIEPLAVKVGPIEPAKSIEAVIKHLVTAKYIQSTASNPILIERHRSSINNIYQKTIDFSSNINNIQDVAIISSELNLLGNAMVELIGIVSPEDVLNSIFSNFCIGK